VIRFWTSWCGPCRRELPELRALAGAAPARFDVISINAGEDPLRVRLIAESWDIPGGVAADPARLAVDACAVDSVPLALVVDADGLVRYRGTTLPADPGGLLDGPLE
jgi:thiol-disulfide isomerase/thioredoxin